MNYDIMAYMEHLVMYPQDDNSHNRCCRCNKLNIGQKSKKHHIGVQRHSMFSKIGHYS